MPGYSPDQVPEPEICDEPCPICGEVYECDEAEHELSRPLCRDRRPSPRDPQRRGRSAVLMPWPEKARTHETRGIDLKIGDEIEVWWRPGVDRVTALAPYKGNLEALLGPGAQVAEFALSRLGMTIEPGVIYDVVVS
jgi:hypothetical protein